jgi:hypothetical protein
VNLGLDHPIKEAKVVAGNIVPRKDEKTGEMLLYADGKYEIRGEGTAAKPYRVSWECLANDPRRPILVLHPPPGTSPAAFRVRLGAAGGWLAGVALYAWAPGGHCVAAARRATMVPCGGPADCPPGGWCAPGTGLAVAPPAGSLAVEGSGTVSCRALTQ